MLVLLLLAADVSVDMVKAAGDRVAAEAVLTQTAPARSSPYRLRPTRDGGWDGKAAALAVTGADCDRIGRLLCTSRGHPVYSAAY